MNSTNTAFKIPKPPQLQPQTELLLYNDILEEKTLALRNTFNEFLKVQPYRKFEIEFSNFLKRTKRIIQEGQRTGANVSRLTNSSQITSLYSRPSTSFFYGPQTTMSMVSSNHNSMLKAPENIFQPIEPLNPSMMTENNSFQPRVLLPRIEQFNNISHESVASCPTVIEVSHVDNETVKTIYENKSNRPSKSSEKSQSCVHNNSYSEMTMIKNNSVSNSQPNKNANNNSNSVESLLGVGFKIVVGLPNNCETSKKSNTSQTNQLNMVMCVEKNLSMWSLNMKLIKSQLKFSKAVFVLTGVLLGEDKITVIEKHHDAGVLECRKQHNLIKTNNGLYRLIGNIIGGSPNELYQTCLATNGVPRVWRNILKQLSGVQKNVKNDLLNFTLDSPAGPTKPVKSGANLNISRTRKGTTYSKVNFESLKNNGKRKHSEHESTENNKKKHRRVHEQLSPLLASTPKKPKKQPTIFETPSQMLRTKLQQNLFDKMNKKSKSQSLHTVNDSISVTKKRQSCSKEQKNDEFIKPKTPIKTSLSVNNSTRHSQKVLGNSTMGSVNSSKHSKQLSINNINNNTTSLSKSRSTINNSSKQLSKLKSWINSTKNNSIDSEKKVKVVKQKENINNKLSSSNIIVNKKDNTNISASIIKPNIKKCTSKLNTVVPKTKTKHDTNVKKKCPATTSTNRGLFDDADIANNGDSDFNIMASPGKLSVISRTDKSRSETPPLFGNQWSPKAKSVVISEPPSPLSKSVEAKALKRVKAPKITLEEEIKKNKVKHLKQPIDYKTVSNKINKMLEFGEHYNSDDD